MVWAGSLLSTGNNQLLMADCGGAGKNLKNMVFTFLLSCEGHGSYELGEPSILLGTPENGLKMP